MLNEDERRVHGVGSEVEGLALPVPRASAARLAELAAYLEARAGGATALVDALADLPQVPAAGMAAALTRVEHRWRSLADRHGLLTGPEVADLAGSRARNRSEHASALARQGRQRGGRRGLRRGLRSARGLRARHRARAPKRRGPHRGHDDQDRVIWGDRPSLNMSQASTGDQPCPKRRSS